MAATKQRYASGPWRGVRTTAVPYDGSKDALYGAKNVYLPDPAKGGAAFSRPGLFAPRDFGSLGGQMVFSGATDTGVYVNLHVANGRIYRQDPTNLNAALVDVTPTGVRIDTTGACFAVILNGTLLFHDGVNTPWYATNLASNPLTAQHVPLTTTPVALSRSTGTPTALNIEAAPFLIGGTMYPGYGPFTAQALPAGTIPTNTWGAYRVTINTSGVITVAAAAANFTSGYASEALALAALPSYSVSTHWSLGHFTVRTATGSPFIGNTDALQGGVGGNPALTTNYYAGEGAPWLAFGQPVVYTGAAFFIRRTLNATTQLYEQSTIVWSEPNQPTTGYVQDGFDNSWTLAQTGGDPIYVLAPTNAALLYARQFAWGALYGAPNVNFQNTATHDLISGNVGCRAPRTVQVFLNWVYFADTLGRPWRFSLGSTPEPLWEQARELFEDNAAATQAFLSSEPLKPFGVIEPNLNIYVSYTAAASGEPTGMSGTPVCTVYDARTGRFMGHWEFPDQYLHGGIIRDSSGGAHLALLSNPAGARSEVRLSRLSRLSDARWQDDVTAIAVRARSDWLMYDALLAFRPVRAVAIIETGDGATPVQVALSAIGTERTVNLGASTPVTPTADGRMARYFWAFGQESGRGWQMDLTASTTTATGQVKLYRMELEAETEQAGITAR